MRTALETALPTEASIKEWFAYGGDPFFFRVRLDVSELGLDESGMTSAVRLILDYKNVRSWLECLETFTRRPLPIAVATAGVMRTLNRVRLWFPPKPVPPARVPCGDGRHHAHPESRAPAFSAGAGGPRASAHRLRKPDLLARPPPSLYAAAACARGARPRCPCPVDHDPESRMSATVRAVVPGGTDDLPEVGGVATDTPEYFCLLTRAGAALEAAAHAAGKPVRLSVIAVGDGDGEVPVPTDDAVALVHEVYRRPIDSLSQDEEDPNICWVHIVIPTTEGGFWIREFGVWAEPLEDDGEPVLYAYGNHAPFYKLKSVLGQATTHELSVPIIMSGTADVEIVVSEAGYASRLELLQIAGVVEDLRRNREAVWTLDAPVEEGGALTLPEGLTYAPGKHLLDVFWDGVACYPGQQYEEISSADALESTAIRLLFAAPAGSEMRVLVRAYSIQPKLEGVEVPEGIAERVDALETRLEDVAANVAYIDKPSHE